MEPIIPQSEIEQTSKWSDEISYIKLFIFLVILGVFMVAPIFIFNKPPVFIIQKEEGSVVLESAILVLEKKQQRDFASLTLDARAVIVWSVNDHKILYARNEETQLPLASLTKLMTAFVASKYAPENKKLSINSSSLSEEGDSGLYANESWLFDDLLDFTLITSSNDGASALAAAAGQSIQRASSTQSATPVDVFVSVMNKTTEEMGLVQTYFINETGLDPTEITSGGYGSAKDVALLLEHILREKPSLLAKTTKESVQFRSLDNFEHTATNTNEAIGDIPGLIASKTGFTDLAGGNLAVAFQAGLNRPIIIVVLSSTKEGRFADVRKLVQAILPSIESF